MIGRGSEWRRWEPHIHAPGTAPGSLAGTVVQALRHVGPTRTAEFAQIAARHLSANDKKTLASTAVQAPAWMRSTLLSIADPAAVWTASDR